MTSKDLTGMRFGRLTVIKQVENYEDADAAIEYIRDNWYVPEEETFPGDPDLRGLALEALRQYVEEGNF